MEEIEELKQNIEAVDNHIYFYTSVDSNTILELITKIREVSLFLLSKGLYEDRTSPELFLHINSDGGSIFDAFAALDTIVSCPVPIITIAEGCVASAATFMLIAGKKRIIRPNSFVLIHQLSHGYSKIMKHDELKDETYNSELLMNHINALYKKYTKLPKKVMTEMLKHDLFLNATQSLSYGIVDEIK